MTPTRLRECLALIGWSQRGLADWLGADERMVRRWTAGVYAVPDPVAEWLERLACYHAAHTPPEDWKRRPSNS